MQVARTSTAKQAAVVVCNLLRSVVSLCKERIEHRTYFDTFRNAKRYRICL